MARKQFDLRGIYPKESNMLSIGRGRQTLKVKEGVLLMIAKTSSGLAFWC